MMKKTAVCTLFEGDYHHGVAALINSLYDNGFSGCFYAGYKGQLPLWATKRLNEIKENGCKKNTFQLDNGMDVCFIELKPNMHFTNFKPYFLQQVWNEENTDIKRIFYFDPDIVIRCNWSFFENWVGFGVALVHEITSNDMPSTSPIRKMWERIILSEGDKVHNRINSYINAGFFGLSKENISFLENYIKYVNVGIQHFKMNEHVLGFSHRSEPFFARDQDALNIAATCSDVPLSELGPEGMDFIHGGFLMSHATFSPKPWNRSYLKWFLMGFPPTLADKSFWNNFGGSITVFGKKTIFFKRMVLKILSFLSRFYSRK
jgi:hypothetical protein